MTKYLGGSFSVPMSGSKVTDEEWDRIFGKKKCKHCNGTKLGTYCDPATGNQIACPFCAEPSEGCEK